MGEVRDIAHPHDRAATERFDLRAHLLEVVATSRGEDHVRTLGREGERDGASEPAAGPG